MSGPRKTGWIIVALAILAAGWFRMETLSKPKTVKAIPPIAFITGGAGPYWQLTAFGAKDAAQELGVELMIEMPSDEEGIGQQTELLMKLDPEKIGGLAVSPLNADGQTRLLNQIAERTNVVTFDADAPLANRRCYVGTSNYGAGKLCAELVEEALPEGGQVAVLLANLTKANLIDRKDGFEDGITLLNSAKSDDDSSSEYVVVDFLVDHGEQERAVAQIKQLLEREPDVKCLVGMNARHGPILLSVLKDLNKLGEIRLVTFDEADAVLAGIEAGHIHATVAQDPYQYGFEAVKRLVSLYGVEEKEQPIVGRSSIHISAEPVRQDNLEEFRLQLRERLGTNRSKQGKDAA